MKKRRDINETDRGGVVSMRNKIMILMMILQVTFVAVVQAQSDKLSLLGRWSQGPTKAMHQRGNYLFVGNGGYLESYQNRNSNFSYIDRVPMPAPVEDIWKTSKTKDRLYAACGKAGVFIVPFDTLTGVLGTIEPIWEEEGAFASGVYVYESYSDTLVYIAAGDAGLICLDISDRDNPFEEDRFEFDEYASDVWILGYRALVTTTNAHLFSLDVQNNITMIDTVEFAPAFATGLFPDLPKPSPYSLLVKSADRNATKDSSIVYIPAGWGGMRIAMHITNYQNTGRDTLVEKGHWIDTIPLDVVGATVVGDYGYAVCGDDGVYGPIDVSDPDEPGIATHSYNTGGYASQVIVSNDTAYVTDGKTGLLLLEALEGSPFELMKTISTSDEIYDVRINDNYAYFAAGITGIQVFNLNISNPPREEYRPINNYNTAGSAMAVDLSGDSLYVADGSNGLVILDVTSPDAIVSLSGYNVVGDTCLDVAVQNQIAYLACGSRGIRVVDASGVLTSLGNYLTPGYAKAVDVNGDSLYVADDIGGVRIYDISNPRQLTVKNSYVTAMSAQDIDYEDGRIFVANGENGVLIWDGVEDPVRYSISGYAQSIRLRGKTVFVSDSENGVRIFDTSGDERFVEVGYYLTYGGPRGMDIADEKVALAAGRDGCYMFSSDIEANLDVSPDDELDFGELAPGYERTRNLWITNSGSSLLSVTEVRININEYEYAGDQQFEVFPGDSQCISIQFKPTVDTPISQPVQGKVAIYSNVGSAEVDLIGDVKAFDPDGALVKDQFTVGLWHFDEQSGSLVSDASGNALHGTVHGNVSWTGTDTSRYGSCIRFNGEGSVGRVMIPSSESLNIYNSSFTIEMWFYMLHKLDEGEFYFLARRGQGSAATRQIEMAITGEEGLTASVWSSDTTQHKLIGLSNADLNAGQWYHTALAWDQDSLYLYVNGILKASKLLRGHLYDVEDEDLAIGANADGEHPLYGYIDEMRFSNIKREPWEFKVNSSKLSLDKSELSFGHVLKDRSRSIPLVIQNDGAQDLEITSIHVTGQTEMITVPFEDRFELDAGEQQTLWITFTPEAEVILDDNTYLVIESSDPTYPIYRLPVTGQGVVNLPAGGYETDDFTLGLWHFDEVGGNTVFDSSGYMRDGVLKNGLSRSSAQRKFDEGYSLSFDGSDDLCLIPAPASADSAIRPAWGGLTVEGWFRMENIRPGGQRVLIRRGSNTYYQFDLLIDATTVVGRVYNENNIAFEVTSALHGAIQPQQWYHTAMTVDTDKDSVYMYLNGDEIDRIAFSGTIAGTTAKTSIDTLSTLIGRDWAGNNTFYGYLDEFRISSVARQPWEFNVNLARITVSTFSINFGSVKLNTSRTIKLWVANPGLDVLEVDTLYLSQKTNFAIDTTHFSVQPGDSQLVRVTFTPSDTTSKTAQLIMHTNSPFWPYLPVTLQGRGTVKATTDPYDPDAFTTGLYHFDELLDGVLPDASDNGNGATMGGDAVLSDEGKYSGSIRFEGESGYAIIPNHSDFLFAQHDFTIDFWFSLFERPVESVLLVSRGTGDNTQFQISLEPSGGIVANVWDVNGLLHSMSIANLSVLNLNQWYHLAFGWDGDSLSINLNKDMYGTSQALTNGLKASTADIILGNAAGADRGYNGYIDEFRISSEKRSLWEYNVLPPTISVFPEKLDFANVVVGKSRTLRLWISNLGDQDLILSGNSVSGSVFSVAAKDTGFTVYQSQVRMMEVTYTPVSANQPNTSWLSLKSNDSENPVELVSLKGTGTTKQIPQAPVNDAHVLALYHFSVVDGDSTVDDSDYEHDAKLHGGLVWTQDGFFTEGVRFDGYNDYLEISSKTGLNLDMSSQSFTIECYFKTDTVSQTLFYRQLDDTEFAQPFLIAVDKNARIHVSGLETSGPNVANGGWHHMAFTFNHITDSCKLYIDGSQIWTQAWTHGTLVTGDYPLLAGGIVEEGSAVVESPFAGYMDEVRISAIAREAWEMAFVDYGISLFSTNPESPSYQTDYTMNFVVPTGLNAAQVFLFYRKGGLENYSQIDGIAANDSIYQMTIPGTGVTLNGLEYYIKIVDTQNEVLTYPTLDGQSNPFALSVRHTGVESDLEFHYQKLDVDPDNNPDELLGQMVSMFSIPFQLDSSKVKDVIEDNLGAYDPSQWLLSYWQRVDSLYTTYNTKTQNYDAFRLLPGRAFWLASHLATSFDLGAFQTVSTSESYAIEVNHGWNMIGNPFNFQVAWENCAVSTDSISTPVYYDGTNGYRLDWPVLEPWKGYWIYNADKDTIPDYIYVRPLQTNIDTRSLAKSASTDEQMGEKDWMIRFMAESDGTKDLDNYVGVRQVACADYDAFDRFEPPRLGGQVQIAFTATENQKGQLAYDIRNQGTQGQVWYLHVNAANGNAYQLSWEFLQTLPEGWGAYLFNLEEQTSVNLLESAKQTFKVDGEENISVQKLVIGDRNFIDAESEGISLVPIQFELFQNFPNPFNPVTEIQFTLPKRAEAKIMIYNTLGQRVAVLKDEVMDAGMHNLQWHGRNTNGIQVASGVYICQLRTKDHVATKKMILLR